MHAQLSQDGRTLRHYYGPWHILVKCSHVLCEDGVERTVFMTAEPDTYFSQRGRTHAHGKTVSGYISYNDDTERYMFTAAGKNANAIPNTLGGPAHASRTQETDLYHKAV